MIEEVQHEWRVEVSQHERRGRLAGALLDETEQQLERIGVAFDSAGTGAALGDQTPQEKVLHQLREADLRRPHDAPRFTIRLSGRRRGAPPCRATNQLVEA
jgi:hypothetical protein